MKRIRATHKQIEFLLNIQTLLREGAFTTTYKYALLMAIADISVERGRDDDRELHIGVGEISEKFIEYYWNHSMPYYAGSVLSEATGRQAVVISKLAEMRQQFASLSALRQSFEWGRLVRKVSQTVKDQPLWKLQTIGGSRVEFIYENAGHGDSITLKRGVCYSFRLFYGLVTELALSGWVEFIRKLPINQSMIGQYGDLEQFLFGENRRALIHLKKPLIEFQKGLCFYCGSRMGDNCEVDHFIPWSIYRRDLGHNFVLADKRCNGRKSSMLAADPHLERWAERNKLFGSELSARFAEINVGFDLSTSVNVAEHAYAQADISGAKLWYRDSETVPVGDGWVRIIGELKRSVGV